MEMTDFSFWAIASVPSVLLVGLAAYGFMTREYRRKGYEPVVNLDALQKELDEAFAPVPKNERVRFGASFQ